MRTTVFLGEQKFQLLDRETGGLPISSDEKFDVKTEERIVSTGTLDSRHREMG